MYQYTLGLRQTESRIMHRDVQTAQLHPYPRSQGSRFGANPLRDTSFLVNIETRESYENGKSIRSIVTSMQPQLSLSRTVG